MVCIRTENRHQASFCPSALREVSDLPELALGHLRYALIVVPPQSNPPTCRCPQNGSHIARARHLAAEARAPLGAHPLPRLTR